MDEFEKVDKLRSRASVTYEEAREALKQADGDILEAMVILEKQGKTTEPAVSTYTTTYEEQEGYEKIEEGQAEEKRGKTFWENLKRFLKTAWGILMENSLCIIKKDGEEAVRLPLIVILVLVFLGVGAAIPVVMLVLLFFGFRYKIVGKDEMPNVNEILNRAGDAADSIKEKFNNAE